MFSYYGSKSKIVQYYPLPIYNTIIEPFAGSARYSLRYYWNKVELNDKYEVIYKIWKYLVNDATEDSINNLPGMKHGDRLPDWLSEAETYLMGLQIGSGGYEPRNMCSPWAEEKNEITKLKKKMLKLCPRIKHWKIENKDYKDIANKEATWFIDPPYQVGGSYYKENKIDYNELRAWCMTRKGQVIVCENSKADWMDFKPLKKMYGQQFTTTEVMWTNINTELF